MAGPSPTEMSVAYPLFGWIKLTTARTGFITLIQRQRFCDLRAELIIKNVVPNFR
jgi:hypothetical protein